MVLTNNTWQSQYYVCMLKVHIHTATLMEYTKQEIVRNLTHATVVASVLAGQCLVRSTNTEACGLWPHCFHEIMY